MRRFVDGLQASSRNRRVGMPEASFGCNAVTETLFELFGFWKSAFLLSGPEESIAHADIEDTSGPRNQGHAAQLFFERRQ